MRERIRFMLIYFAFWTIYFVCARIIFLSYHIEDSKNLTIETVSKIFYHGFRMDLSMAGYLSLLPFIWVTFSNFIKKSIFQNTIFSYTFVFVFLITFLIVVDLEVYNIWSFRIDGTPLNYLKSPKEAWASIKSSPVLPLLLSFIILIFIANYFVYRIIANKIYDWKVIKNFPFIIYGLLLAGILIIPIRGGLGIAPMNHSSVYFSKINFANISAINAPWNFFSSVINRSSNKVNLYTYLPKEVLDKTLNQLYQKSKKNQKLIEVRNEKPNVLIIIWESCTSKALNKKIGDYEVLPNFSSLIKKNIYFSNFYAMGDRTDKGITSILSGYPSQPTESIIKHPNKTASLPVLSKDFGKNGYSTRFYYGGDTEFANIKSYLFNSNFERIVDMNDFPQELSTSKWGVHDEYLFDKFLEDQKYQSNKPFFATLLTLTSHEPFETPRKVVIEGESNENKFMNSLRYTDEVLGEFLEKARQQTWWDNTLVIILADHGHPLPDTKNRIDNFKIPMVWTGGLVNKRYEINKIGSQVDLAATLLGQLKMDASSYIWSKDIFNFGTKSWAFFTFNDGFGYIKPNGKDILFDNVGRIPINHNPKVNSKDISEGKALLQKTFQDFLDR